MNVNTQLVRDAIVPTRKAEITKAAEQLVAQTFFGTLMKHMRDSPFRSDLFDGGRGGQAFQAQLDQELAQRMAHGAAKPLVRAIVKRIERNFATKGEAKQD